MILRRAVCQSLSLYLLRRLSRLKEPKDHCKAQTYLDTSNEITTNRKWVIEVAECIVYASLSQRPVEPTKSIRSDHHTVGLIVEIHSKHSLLRQYTTPTYKDRAMYHNE